MSKAGSHVCTCQSSVSDILLLDTRQSELSWQELYTGSIKEQEKPRACCQIVRGNSKCGIYLALGGRPDCSSVEIAVTAMEQRIWHVMFYKQLTTVKGMTDYLETKSQPVTKLMVWQAYKEVRANGGSGGIDKMGWDYLAQNASTQIYKLWNRLTSGSYFPQPVKQVAIPKKDKGIRLLGIPTLLDRIAQQVVRTHLERVLEPLFHNSSFGYRPQRNCHQAVKQAYTNTLNHDFAIDLDIKGFFDNIDHQLLLQALRHYCKDNWVVMYVERWLKAGVVQQDGKFAPTLSGTPQGGVISPLLANLFLHVVFDKWMEKYHPEKPFERYADDIVVHCKTERQALFMLHQINQRLNSCNLHLHQQKTKVVNLRGTAQKQYPKGFDFLGFTIRPGAYNHRGTIKAMPGIFVSQKSKSGIMQKFKSMAIHKRRKPLEELARMVNPVARGIMNYYHKFQQSDMSMVWTQLNARLLKWVKWEKDLYKKAAVKYLQTKHKENPQLFAHWLLVHP